MASDKALRKHLLELLQGESAHLKAEAVIKGFPARLQGKRPKGVAHSPWQLLEHMRIGQWDILEFSRDAKHVSPKWPEGYWPKSAKPASEAAWKKSIAAIKKSLGAMIKLVENPKTDLYAKIPHGSGQNIMREALLVADHN